MKYKLNFQQDTLMMERITVDKARFYLLSIGFIALSIALGAYFGLNFFEPTSDSEVENYLLTMIVSSLIGGGFLIASLFIGRVLRQFPEKVVFNNHESIVEIYHNSSVAKKASVPYEEISEFSIRNYQVAPSSSKSLFEDRFSSVIMILKDGTVWEITDGSKDSRYAEENLETIKNHISLMNISKNTMPINKLRSRQLNLEIIHNELIIDWKNYSPIRQVKWIIISVFLMLILGFAATILVSISSEEGGQTWEDIFSSLNKNIDQIDLEILFDTLGNSLAFVSIAFMISLIPFLINLMVLFFSKWQRNKIILNKSHFINTRDKIKIPSSQIGNIFFKYYLSDKERSIQINKKNIEFKSQSHEFLDLSQVNDFKSFAKMSFGLFKSSLKDFTSGKLNKDQLEIEANTITTICFDKFSPVDIFHIYANLKYMLKD
ncbi:hypothetical protein ND861_18385 [Leptospira sp. 2 VSF19]|uniref:DUF2207 domain-containing protein n=1 Tax=Leptospira soteropolitanensis TaxID=2950025 RepID=A0AAW5VPX9_9LEPT|nr:hypothetical protein [Leptospira soteropolitanensis]MCW7494620.1 hypothetical protein [Leptospira soteropolitanensis]MCW7502212.1 hypothetical protein [Leptospira soteropolitanensis]MCW7524466.1 hypothetical protein [Leptospira soteropolitanensis]MCW7528332.1 hypothetical protein [Leptospira soteropolitanensis]MCW7532185.1 hypothetical protein [Leptospira soteropolitanensis]